MTKQQAAEKYVKQNYLDYHFKKELEEIFIAGADWMEQWVSEKPVFTHDCILLTATNIRQWSLSSWLIIWQEGYWKWCEMDGEEYGDIEDLQADLYKVIALPPAPKVKQ